MRRHGAASATRKTPATTPSAQYSLTIRVEIDHRPGMLGKVASAIGEAGGTIGAVDLVERRGRHTIRDITVDDRATPTDWPRLTDARRRASTARACSTRPTARSCCTSAARSRCTTSSPLKTRDDLSMAYTPGVARVCAAIHDDPDKAFQYTIKRNTVAVVSDGTAVLGPRRHRPAAAMPVMEGKAMLFKEFAGVDAFPICLDTKDPDEIVDDRQGDRARLRRHQPRGHLRPALLRDRGAAARPSSTSRSSTTTSTAPRSSCSPRC